MHYSLSVGVFSFQVNLKSFIESPEGLDLSEVAKIVDQFASLASLYDKLINIYQSL